MIYDRYPYETPPLPYAYEALEPYIDAETMHYHHDKHFQSYVNNLNNVLEKHPRLQRLTLEQILKNPGTLPHVDREAILNNAGGVYNHYKFFNSLAPPRGDIHMPEGWLADAINAAFGSFERFKGLFTKQAQAVFGSGYAVLALGSHGRLKIFGMPNQDTAIATNWRTVLLFDVWEHAYYLKYKNLRAEYIGGIWNVVHFPKSIAEL